MIARIAYFRLLRRTPSTLANSLLLCCAEGFLRALITPKYLSFQFLPGLVSLCRGGTTESHAGCRPTDAERPLGLGLRQDPTQRAMRVVMWPAGTILPAVFYQTIGELQPFALGDEFH